MHFNLTRQNKKIFFLVKHVGIYIERNQNWKKLKVQKSTWSFLGEPPISSKLICMQTCLQKGCCHRWRNNAYTIILFRLIKDKK